MDLIPVSNHQEYVVLDNNFKIVQFSPNIQKYVEQKVAIGADVRTSFPEIVGLESVCREIRLGKQNNFTLENVTRVKEQQAIYFDLYIQSIEAHLTILLEDVTELTTLKQASMQRLNEAELTLNKLQRFEYCTNKIIASMRDVLLITTPEGKIERVNKSTTELFNQKKSELLDCLIDDLIQDPSFSHQQTYNLLISAQDLVEKVEVNFVTPQNKTIHIEFDCFVAPTEIKNFYNCVYIGRDITARKQAEAEIRKSLQKEKELRQLKSGFISMASHEFRNPLSSILLCVQNLKDDSQVQFSEREFYLQSIQDAAFNMNSLLEDILVLSQAESGKRRLKLETIDLKYFSEQIIQELGAIYSENKINFKYLVKSNLVELDRLNLRHILSNLLSNALKYSSIGEAVDLTIYRSDDNTKIVIEVKDRGIGIPEESQKHLFESFYRAGNVNNTPGTGLGLAIVKKAVDLYQGSIVIDSQVNRGTNVKVKLLVNLVQT